MKLLVLNFINKQELLFVFILAVVFSFAFFGNGIGGDFVFDDVAVVKNRGDLNDPSYFLNLFIDPYHQGMPKTGLYRPFTMASYAVNHFLGGSAGLTAGSSATGFHIVNILVHAVSSLLVFWLVRYFLKLVPYEAARAHPIPVRYGASSVPPLRMRSQTIAYFSFFLFLVLPIHTEAVTSIVGRAELLAFFWSLATIYFFTKNFKFLALLSFLFALWSKETALALLPTFLYIDIYFIGSNLGQSVKRAALFAFPLGVYSLFRYAALGQYFTGDVTTSVVENQLRFVGFFERIATALKVLYMYVERLVWPMHLSADYSYNRIAVVENLFKSPQALLGLLFLFLLFWLAIRYRKEKKELGLGAVLFLFPYLMVSNLIKPIGTIMGERLMYFPSLGFVILVSYLLNRFRLHGRYGRKLAYLILSMAVIFYGARTIIRNGDWKDQITLFFATVEESPGSLITRTALAGIYMRADELDKAKEQLEIARKIHEDNAHLQNLLGIIAEREGNPRLAEEKFKKALELSPDAINSHVNLAELYLKQKKFKEAGDSFLKVIEFFPVAEHLVRYAYTQVAINNPEEAIRVLNRYAGGNLKHPDFSVAIGTAYFVKGDYKEALLYLQNARELGNKTAEVGEMIKIAKGKIKNQ